MQAVKSQVKFVVLVGLLHPPEELGHPGQGHLVQFLPVLYGNQVFFRVEIVEVPQHEAGGVPETPVGIAQLLQDIGRQAHVVPVVLRGDPQAQDFGAVLVHDFLGGDDVAQGFGHLAAVAVHHEAVGQHPFIRRRPPGAHAGQEAAVEPAPVLVRAFQIEVRGQAQVGVGLQHCGPTHPGVEPDVQDVGLLVEGLTMAPGHWSPGAGAPRPGPRTRSPRPPAAPGHDAVQDLPGQVDLPQPWQ